MNKEKKIWLFEQYAQKMWTIAINLTQEAARMGGTAGRGFAIVAEECRHLSEKITAYVGTARFDGGKDENFKGITDAALQIKLLVANALLEHIRLKVSMGGNSDHRVISVCIEEIRALACSIENLLEEQHIAIPERIARRTEKVLEARHIASPPIPEIISPLKSTETYDYFLQYSIGGIPLIENAGIINTIEYPSKEAVGVEIFNLRGLDVPVIDLYKRFNLKKDGSDRQTVLIISHGDKKYLVPVDDLDERTLFLSKIGCNVPPRAGHIFADYTRECWDAVGGDQFLFLDWDKFI